MQTGQFRETNTKKSFDLFSLENVKTKAEQILLKGFYLAPPRLSLKMSKLKFKNVPQKVYWNFRFRFNPPHPPPFLQKIKVNPICLGAFPNKGK